MLLSSLGRDLHQVQKPFPIFVPFGPLNVQRGFDRRLQRRPQVVYLTRKINTVGERFNPIQCLRTDQTYSECVVNHAADLFFRHHGTFSSHCASKRNPMGADFPAETRRSHIHFQVLYITEAKKNQQDLRQHTHPLTDRGSSITTLAFTFTWAIRFCTLVLKEKTIPASYL